MTGRVFVPAALADVLHGPTVPGASCHGVAPDWDRTIPGEDAAGREARVQLARRVCRRCPGLARCLELLEQLDESGACATDVVIAGEIRGSSGEVLAPRWSLVDAVEGGKGVGATGDPGADTGKPERPRAHDGEPASPPAPRRGVQITSFRGTDTGPSVSFATEQVPEAPSSAGETHDDD